MRTARTPPQPTRAATQRAIATTFAVAGFVLTTGLALAHPEGIVQFDDLTHFLYAKWAWTWPAYLCDAWGRPGFTLLYFIPAAAGWPACRILSALLSAAAAYMAFEFARNLRLNHAWLVVPLAYAQPLFFQLSQTTLTETPAAFYITAAALLAQRNRWLASSLLLSAAFVTRHEALVLAPCWLYFTARAGAFRHCWGLLVMPLLVNIAAVALDHPPPALEWFSPKPGSEYGRGGWLTFLSRSLEAWGPAVAILAAIGLPALLRRRGVFVVVSIIALFSTHTVLRALGLYASGGYARFLVPLSPMIAVAALAGLQQLFARRPPRRSQAAWIALAAMSLLWVAMERQLALYRAQLDEAAELPELHLAVLAMRIATVAISLIALAAALLAHKPRYASAAGAALPASLLGLMALVSWNLCRSLSPPPEAAIIDDTLRWIAGSPHAGAAIISDCVWIDYAAGHALPPDRPGFSHRLAEAPAGSLLLWERQFAGSPAHRFPLDALLSHPSLRLLHRSAPLPLHDRPYLCVFEVLAPTKRPS